MFLIGLPFKPSESSLLSLKIFSFTHSTILLINFAFMLRNSSIDLKNMYTFGGTKRLNLKITAINCKVFIRPHIMCIEKDINI
ncbi:hypothetical protein FGO68_gene9984 [Halteria grandinella]|uniref:Uncharacterized protein n=1 Tax=Halteria grandinella TaxID=5974 RepID=A0A8J8STY8_HALGN|nr:hypothetical protein FGO68_gene9984 [Halteria grandinella]